MKKIVRYSLASLVFVLVALALFACGGSGTQEAPAQETSEQVLIFPEEFVEPGTVIPTSPQSGKLYESTGLWPPSSPGFPGTSVVGGATTEHGTFSRTANFASIALSSANYATFAAALNAASPTLSYAQVDVQYDTTYCTPPVTNCPLISWRLGVHTCSVAWQFPCPETAFVN